MTIQPLSVLRVLQHRSAADHDLSQLFAAVTSAREAVQVGRGTPCRDDVYRRACGRLAASLDAYATALETYQLPVPPEIRDELRLRLQLSS